MEPGFSSAAALVESMLGRRLVLDRENALMTAARDWLTKNRCPRKTDARGRGPYLVTDELANRFAVECWPRIKHLARSPRRG